MNNNETLAPNRIEIRTSGACKGNKKTGGYGAILRRVENGKVIKKVVVSGEVPHTTNHRMELLAAIAALEKLKITETVGIYLHSRSEYLILGMNGRAKEGRARGWRKTNKKEILNIDLWKRLLAVSGDFKVHWIWTRDQKGAPLSEEAAIANKAALGALAKPPNN